MVGGIVIRKIVKNRFYNARIRTFLSVMKRVRMKIYNFHRCSERKIRFFTIFPKVTKHRPLDKIEFFPLTRTEVRNFFLSFFLNITQKKFDSLFSLKKLSTENFIPRFLSKNCPGVTFFQFSPKKSPGKLETKYFSCFSQQIANKWNFTPILSWNIAHKKFFRYFSVRFS